MAALTEWLQLMLAEIARKREDLEQARAEEARRASETPPKLETGRPEVRSLEEARAARRSL
jgi:hypothetical protein